VLTCSEKTQEHHRGRVLWNSYLNHQTSLWSETVNNLELYNK